MGWQPQDCSISQITNFVEDQASPRHIESTKHLVDLTMPQTPMPYIYLKTIVTPYSEWDAAGVIVPSHEKMTLCACASSENSDPPTHLLNFSTLYIHNAVRIGKDP